MLFSVKSMTRISVNVAMIDAGIASAEMITARMLRMKNITTMRGEQAAPEQVLFERGDRRVDEPRVVADDGQRRPPAAASGGSVSSFALDALDDLDRVLARSRAGRRACTAGRRRPATRALRRPSRSVSSAWPMSDDADRRAVRRSRRRCR